MNWDKKGNDPWKGMDIKEPANTGKLKIKFYHPEKKSYYIFVFVISALYAALFGIGMGWEDPFVIFFVIFFICNIFLFIYLSILDVFEGKKKEKQLENEREKLILLNRISKIDDFSIDDYFILENNSAFIAVDENRRKLVIGGKQEDSGEVTYELIMSKSILGVDVTEDGKGLLSDSGDINTLGMAAVGGLMFGGEGAVVGAIAGSNTESRIIELNLRVALDDIKMPYIAMNFLTSATNRRSSSHKKAIEATQKWFGIISILTERDRRKF